MGTRDCRWYYNITLVVIPQSLIDADKNQINIFYFFLFHHNFLCI